MTFDDLRAYCASRPAATESFPFDETTLVFKVKNKMFALTRLSGDAVSVNLKCDPDRSDDLRERYEAVRPGYHMSKRHWNTIDCESDLTDGKIYELIDHSYRLVVAKLKRSDRLEIEALIDAWEND